MDSEIVNVIIAVAVIYFVVKWATSGGSDSSANATGGTDVAKILGFKPKKATPDMIASVRAAFPDIPTDNIHYDLLRTGSVELTVNRLLERGYLDPPPAAYRRAFPATSTSDDGTIPVPSGDSKLAGKPAAPQVPSLIQRFQLESKLSDGGDELPTWDGTGPIPSAAKGKGRAGSSVTTPPTSSSNASIWEATKEQRQSSLQKRKEAMIIAARQRLLEKESASKGTTQ